MKDNPYFSTAYRIVWQKFVTVNLAELGLVNEQYDTL